MDRNHAFPFDLAPYIIPFELEKFNHYYNLNYYKFNYYFLIN